MWAAVLACACTSGPHLQAGPPVVSRAGPSGPSGPGALVPEYRLGFGDVIAVRFFRNEEFDETLTVRPDGRISLPRLGDLQVAGMTPSELDSAITAAYGGFLVDPDVTVIVREFGGYQVYVLGQVKAPGGFPIAHNMTVLQALALAGGTTVSAKLGNVMVVRRGQGPGLEVLKLDLNEVPDPRRGPEGAGYALVVQPEDIVFVPQTRIGSTAEFMELVYDGFLPPIDMYVRALLYRN
ncbi:MAG: polysaccharide biosynthesis/export family protein [Candidatus Latescibacterota bacterium]